MNKIEELYKYLPEEKIDWELIKKELLKPFVQDLEVTNQEFKWHSEGNVLNHTYMVVEKLISLDEFKELSKIEKLVVFLSALFHDVGKIKCTKIINNEITSFHHGSTGSKMIREYLWKDLLLSGNKEYQSFREAICLLIKYHSAPVHYYEKLTKKVIKLSLNHELTKYYNLKLLTILAKADILGRISTEVSDHYENLMLFIEEAKQLNCFDKAFKFDNSYTRYQYLNNDNIWPYDKLYNPSWGTIILICGLPGTGKDTYIKEHYKDIPVISLDDIREEYHIDPKDNQGVVYNKAKERAKELLRNKNEFIWNATNISTLIRSKQINLFHNYNANVKIIFLETSFDKNIDRNKNRIKEVSEKIILKLLSNIDIPEMYESEDIEWICV